MNRPRLNLSLYLVTDPELCARRGVEVIVAEAIAGGATVVQLRDKAAETRTVLELARRLKALLESHGVPLILNDRVDVALAMDADGVHVGQDDMPAKEARRLIGRGKIVGLSVGDEREIAGLDPTEVDYAGLGPVWATSTKPDSGAALGISETARLRRLIPVPTVGIGGINESNAAETIAAGLDGIAVVSAICAAKNPRRAAAGLKAAVMSARQGRV